MLLLQELMQGIIATHMPLEAFISGKNSKVKMEFSNRQESLFIARDGNIISIAIDKPYYRFEFKLYKGTPTWGEVSCCVGEEVYPVLINDGTPGFSAKGYSYFREFANELSHRLEIDEWLNNAILISQQNSAPVKTEVKLPVETFTRFQTIIHKILAKHDLLEAFYDPSCESVYLKLRQESYMDLVIERQPQTVFVGHYLKQNGDLISDPILVFQLREGVRAWAPFRIEQIFGDTQIMFEQEGKMMIYPKRLREFKSFSNMFAKNIKDQEWLDAEVVDISCVMAEENVPEPSDLAIIPQIIDNTGVQLDFGF